MKNGWINGFFPIGHGVVNRIRGDKRPGKLLSYHRDMDMMRGKVMKSLKDNSNATYRDTFCDNVPHNNHIRAITLDDYITAADKCFDLMKQNGWCALHC